MCPEYFIRPLEEHTLSHLPPYRQGSPRPDVPVPQPKDLRSTRPYRSLGSLFARVQSFRSWGGRRVFTLRYDLSSSLLRVGSYVVLSKPVTYLVTKLLLLVPSTAVTDLWTLRVNDPSICPVSSLSPTVVASPTRPGVSSSLPHDPFHVGVLESRRQGLLPPTVPGSPSPFETSGATPFTNHVCTPNSTNVNV